jgi:hypothetical protein
LVWDGDEVDFYDDLLLAAAESGLSLADYIRDRLGSE